MKLLIAYDGSSGAEAALDDLVRAGLPPQAEAFILSIAEVWLPPPKDESVNEYAAESNGNSLDKKNCEHGVKPLSEVKTLARHAGQRLKHHFPAWKIETEANYGSPAQKILRCADEFEADLVIVGSHGRSALNRLIPGSISQKVLTEASCSVRIARGKVELDEPVSPERIIVGFDGSPGAQAAVRAIAARQWREKSEVRLVVATDPLVPLAIGRFVQPIVNWTATENQRERQWVEQLAEDARQTLRYCGLTATIHIENGNPRHILIEEAEKWRADSIFVGANAAGGAIQHFLLGSVSAAVAARAHCSVEVVRKNAVKSEIVAFPKK